MRKDDGYALLEVLIALLMFTLMAGAAGGLLSRASRKSAEAPAEIRAEIENRNQLTIEKASE